MEQGYQTGQGHYFKDILRHQKLLVPICGVYPWNKFVFIYHGRFHIIATYPFQKVTTTSWNKASRDFLHTFSRKKTKTASLKKHNTGHLCGRHRRHTELVSYSISPFAPTRNPKMAVEVNNLRALRSLYCPKVTYRFFSANARWFYSPKGSPLGSKGSRQTST